jgi:hypothetical protein
MSEPNIPTPKNRRAFPRRAARKVKVTCRKGSLDLGPNLAQALLDLCENGVRMLVKVALEEGQEISIGMEGPTHRRPVVRPGRVVWSEKSAEDTYCVGVRLEKYLSYADIRMMT